MQILEAKYKKKLIYNQKWLILLKFSIMTKKANIFNNNKKRKIVRKHKENMQMSKRALWKIQLMNQI